MTDPRLLRPTSIPWPPILLVAAFVAALIMKRAVPLTWPGLDDLPARVIGTGFGLGGLALMIWGFMTLQRHRTTVMPHQGVDHLVTDGPYRFRRNPIYLGEVLLMLGMAELTKNIWFVIVALVFALLLTVLQIIPEERHLEAKFGDTYRDYKERTRRWI